MQLTQRDLEIFRCLNRYRYLRRTFIHALLGAPPSADRLRHRIYHLEDAGYLHEPERQKATAYYKNKPNIYELGIKGKRVLEETGIRLLNWASNPNEFWHQLMVSDVVASIEIACRWKNVPFYHRSDRATPQLHLDVTGGQVRPDELFFINGSCFVLEADRSTEPNASINRHSSWARKIEAYTDAFRSQSYRAALSADAMLVLNLFVSDRKAENVRAYIEQTLGKKSRSLWFGARPILGSYEQTPLPLPTILDDLWHRAGHEPITILSALSHGKEVMMVGHHEATRTA